MSLSLIARSFCALLLANSALSTSDVYAEKDKRWAQSKKPAPGPSLAIGGYSRGCVQGATAIPSSGTGYQTMRPSRKRVFGHPVLIEYIEDFAEKLSKKKGGYLLIGDLGQAMGGPSLSGHASHQSGLDVDIWFWHPKAAEKRSLTNKERERLSARKVVDKKKKRKTVHWNRSIERMLRIATDSDKVSRIFVNPLIKKQLCDSKSKNRKYLSKIRPWYGHADHMHVRLHCPANSGDCEAQTPLAKGDGCDKLDWWFDETAQEARKKSRQKYQAKVGATPEMPEICQRLIEPGSETD